VTLDDLPRLIATPPMEYRPELRWWLAEGLHTDETLGNEIDTAHRLGFGGMEFLAMDEAAVDHARFGWGAEEWVHPSQIVVEETTKRRHVGQLHLRHQLVERQPAHHHPEHPAAAKELNVVFQDLSAGTARRPATAHRLGRGAAAGVVLDADLIRQRARPDQTHDPRR
jgi:hypothetical protein